ncbi:UNVERIFIED_CONTAM: hypothetical protein Sindi_0470300 [Sesamum indicum]
MGMKLKVERRGGVGSERSRKGWRQQSSPVPGGGDRRLWVELRGKGGAAVHGTCERVGRRQGTLTEEGRSPAALPAIMAENNDADECVKSHTVEVKLAVSLNETKKNPKKRRKRETQMESSLTKTEMQFCS